MDTSAKTAKNGSRYYEYVIDSIKNMIATGEVKCGEKIPSERDLAERFNVSRVPIREALKILEYMGVLDSSRGDGTYVRNNTVEDLISKMNFSVTATGNTIMDLLELRICLESFAAYHAAQRRTDEDIEALKQAIMRMRKAKRQPQTDDVSMQELRQLSHGFHQCMIQAAHNSVLTSVYENLFELLDISRQFTTNTSGISYNSILAHEAIFNKIVEQDADGAREAMEEHLGDVRMNLAVKLEAAEMEELLQIDPGLEC